MSTILWSKLGSPTEPGTVRVEGLGIVEVSQGDIDIATSAGGDPEFDLEESTRMGDKMHRYLLGLMR